MKANSNQAVIRTFVEEGAGLDVVSEGELRRALAAGGAPDKIVFAGVGKTAREIALAVDTGILCFNVESEPELDADLGDRHVQGGQSPRSPSASIPTSTPRPTPRSPPARRRTSSASPIERAREVYAHAAELPGIRVTGVDMHIGSQITDLAPYDAAYGLLADLVRTLRADGHAIDHVDAGGGLGIPYRLDDPPPPEPAAYGEVVRRRLGNLGARILFEPGRVFVGNAGILVSRGRLREEGRRQDLRHPRRRHERPDSADALRGPPRHPAGATSRRGRSPDGRRRGRRHLRDRRLSRARPALPPVQAGDLVAIMTAGAYGAVQARPTTPGRSCRKSW